MSNNKEVGTFYCCWSKWEWPVDKIPAKDLTRIYLAFLDVDVDGTVKAAKKYEYIFDVAKELIRKAKAKNPDLKLMFSIGGSPEIFSSVAADSNMREKFAETAKNVVELYKFDGVDIDWEYPADKTDGHNFVFLLEACRRALGNGKDLSFSSPTGSQNYYNLDFPGMNKYLDFYNFMGYDLAGHWNDKSTHSSNLHQHDCNQLSIDGALKDYLDSSVPANKIILGMPLYGVVFEGTDGLCEPYESIRADQPFYADLLKGPTSELDQEAGASYTFDKRTFISWDTPEEIKLKAAYVNSRGLAGGFFWQCGGDAKDKDSAVAAFKQGLQK
ncbi:glycoside hydrolase [Aspergillus pseudoustus]|uniref:chitinase n=1 Tax=Aspergillus pseudoustus TaxID=1810923 RepID=A0ABR4IZB0_9EURO